MCVQYVIYYIKFDIFVETKEGGLGRNCRIDLLKFILCLWVPVLLPFVMDIFVNIFVVLTIPVKMVMVTHMHLVMEKVILQTTVEKKN